MQKMYIHKLLSAYQLTVALWSSRQNRLAVPASLNRIVIASRAFQNDAFTIWNVLFPQHLYDMIQISGAQRDVNATVLHVDNMLIILF